MTTLVASPTTLYAESVLAGEVTTGELVRLACQRHLEDLEYGHERGLWFDADQAQVVVNFFRGLRHHKGEWAGRPVILEPWQEFLVGSIFGWKRWDEETVQWLRRFSTAYIEVGRKNGKSTLAAGVGLYTAFFDNEQGAEVYAAATKRDQAKIVWGEARQMVLRSPGLRQWVTPLTNNLHSTQTASKFEPLGSDQDTLDGLNTHCAIIDELHAHKNRGLWDVLDTSTGSRRQPLVFVITTAGWDKLSVCWEQHDYGERVLRGIVPDDSFFAYIATIDQEDDWADEACWIKANPNLGVSKKLEYLRTQCTQAVETPGKQNAFKRLHLDMWTEQASRWLDMNKWDSCVGNVDEDELEGQSCYAGLDLSSTTDLTSLSLVFPNEEGQGCKTLSFSWMPEDRMLERSQADRVPYDLWAQQGYLLATEGNVVDYDQIRADINTLNESYYIVELAIDRWNSTQLQTQLMGDGFTIVPFGQGFASMSAPTKELERQITAGTLEHGGNPVLRLAASNVAVVQDAAGNLKPAKDKSNGRIDPITALIMALGRAQLGQDEDSYYEGHDMMILGDEEL